MPASHMYSEVTGRGKERERTWGSAIIGVECRVPRVLQVHSSLINIKHKVRIT